MKKRRELDALVSTGKVGKRKLVKDGHELLRSQDSDSSEIEFSVPSQKSSVIRKKRKCQFCSSCMPFCYFFLVTICLIICGGLVWFEWGMRKELVILRGKILSVESGNKGTPEEIQELSTKVTEFKKQLSENHLDDMKSKIQALEKLTNELKTSIDKTPQLQELQELPKKFADLEKNVASFGSSLTTLTTNVEALQKSKTENDGTFQQITKTLTDLQKQVSSNGKPSTSSPNSSQSNQLPPNGMSSFETALNNLNSTLKIALNDMQNQMSSQKVLITSNINKTNLLESKLSSLPNGNIQSNNNSSTVSDAMIEDIVKKVVKILKSSNSTVLSPTSSTSTNPDLVEIAGDILNVTNVVKQLKYQVDGLEQVHKSINASNSSSSQINDATVKLVIKQELDKYEKEDIEREQKYEADISNLNNSINELKQRLNAQQLQLAELKSDHSTFVKNSAKNSTTNNKLAPTPPSSTTSTTQVQTDKILPKRDDSKVVKRTTASDANEPLYKIVVPDIFNKNDLFNRADLTWDQDFDNEFSEKELTDALKERMIPWNYLKVYDANNNNRLDYDELSQAFGFSKVPESIAKGRQQIPYPYV